ncbi:hypothetical protein CTheo_7494 [Ceratobasidium theobromae]|uniref:Uncharacterized protein n=1 Tax=Ceratobasidium theobromae TaxID=1582974 RepID=A0A5N5QC24_9AGAM|nr:hypothetical protein CTheo_7494 [Ceratobasidium theobromae]
MSGINILIINIPQTQIPEDDKECKHTALARVVASPSTNSRPRASGPPRAGPSSRSFQRSLTAKASKTRCPLSHHTWPPISLSPTAALTLVATPSRAYWPNAPVESANTLPALESPPVTHLHPRPAFPAYTLGPQACPGAAKAGCLPSNSPHRHS